MEREGFVVVENTHPLFPKVATSAIVARVKAILIEIEKTHHIGASQVSFKITSLAKSGQPPSIYIKSVFSTGSIDRIRFLFTIDKLTSSNVEPYFENSPLFVTITEVIDPDAELKVGLLSARSCHINVPASRSVRVIEDLMVDIALGNLLSQSGALFDVVRMEEFSGLYRRKAKYFRSRARASWIASIDRGAAYAPLSALNKLPDDDVKGRAAAAYAEWLRFIASVSLGAASHGTIGSEIAAESESAASNVRHRRHLSTLKRFGRQLPIRRIEAVAKTLPDGRYMIMVLRRSSALRKSPSLRGRIVGLFGLNARINSFRFIPADAFMPAAHTVQQLAKSGHLKLIEVKIDKGTVDLQPFSQRG